MKNPKNIRHYFKKAEKEHWAIGQFNFSDLTQFKGIVEKASELHSPVILGTSEGESKFFGLEEAVALRNVLRTKGHKGKPLPIFLNLDHGKSFEYVKEAIDAGYDMVHFDGSKLPLEENIRITKEVVKYAKGKGVVVEGEVGKIGTESSKIYSEKFEINEENLTKPEEAQKFIKATGVDLLAVSIGNFHGIEASGIDPDLRLSLLKDIKKLTVKTGLVLHGGSGTRQNDVEESIKTGIVKININTEMRVAFSENLRKSLDSDKQEIVPYKFLIEAKKAVELLVERKTKIFGSADKA